VSFEKIQISENGGSTGAHVHQIPSPDRWIISFGKIYFSHVEKSKQQRMKYIFWQELVISGFR
jgi:hypothetical protein